MENRAFLFPNYKSSKTNTFINEFNLQ